MAQVLGPLQPGYVRIVNPKHADEWLILHSRDFDPAQHTLWVAPPEAAASEGEPVSLGTSAAPTEEGDAVLPRRSHKKLTGNDLRAYGTQVRRKE